MSENIENEKEVKNFFSWFLSSNQLQEKVISVGVLFLEILLLMNHSTESRSIFILESLNLVFLLYFIFDLKNHFKLEFKIDNLKNIKHLDLLIEDEHKLLKIQSRANDSIKQFSQFGGFLISTAFLYLFLIVFKLENIIYINATHGSYLIEFQEFIKYFFNFFLHFLSYIGVIYVLKCFYVLYFPTFEDEDNVDSNLNDKTKFYWFIALGILIIELILTFPVGEHYKVFGFYFEFICGIINSFVLILFFARFESRLLGINPFITLFLYIYAIVQTSLPLVSGNVFDVSSLLNSNHENGIDMTFLITLILSICLFAKIILYNIIVYLYQTKRLFYYFINTKLNYDKQEEYWREFNENSTLD